jgi:RNA polymerase sigma-70 factor, ECF subfamily
MMPELTGAGMTDSVKLGEQLPEFRDYLCVLAQAQISPRLQAKLDASDLVQQTLLEAHRDLNQFRGTTRGEMAAWLRQILARNLANAVRHLERDKRDVGREESLEQRLEESSIRLEEWLADAGLSPGDQVMHEEMLLRLSSALLGLPPAQREAIELRHLQGWTLQAIAEHLNRTPGAVAGLLHRGLAELRILLSE